MSSAPARRSTQPRRSSATRRPHSERTMAVRLPARRGGAAALAAFEPGKWEQRIYLLLFLVVFLGVGQGLIR